MARRRRFGELMPFPYSDPLEAATVAEEGVFDVPSAPAVGRRPRGRSFESPVGGTRRAAGAVAAGILGSASPAVSRPPSASAPAGAGQANVGRPVSPGAPAQQIVPTAPGRVSPTGLGQGRRGLTPQVRSR